MGKSLIIKGADFSANGFRYSEIVTDASTLYGANETVITSDNWADLETAANGQFACEETDGSFALSYGVKYNAYAKADCSQADKVTVKTRPASPPQSIYYGFAVLLFTDAQGNIVGGYTNAPTESTSPSGKTTPIGTSGDLVEYEANVPAGAKYVYSTYGGNNISGSGVKSPFDSATKFEMKLIKYSQE